MSNPKGRVRVDVSGANEGDPLTHEGTARHYLMLRLSLLRKPLGAVFAQFTQTYRSAEEAQCAFADAVAAVAAGKGTPAEAAAKLSATMDGSEMLVETLASVVLLPLDTVLTALRHGLHGSDRCRDEGPTIVGGVTVDRALDSVGNLLRHRHEWARRIAAGEPARSASADLHHVAHARRPPLSRRHGPRRLRRFPVRRAPRAPTFSTRCRASRATETKRATSPYTTASCWPDS